MTRSILIKVLSSFLACNNDIYIKQTTHGVIRDYTIKLDKIQLLCAELYGMLF